MLQGQCFNVDEKKLKALGSCQDQLKEEMMPKKRVTDDMWVFLLFALTFCVKMIEK